MKRLTFLLLLLCCNLWSMQAQTRIQASFDERVDLIAMVARLAESPEYSQCIDSLYAAEADRYFQAYKEHKAVKLYREIRKQGVSYDAVAAYAMHLQRTDNKKAPWTYVDNIRKGSDTSFSRWPKKKLGVFLKALNAFYTESDFHRWFQSTATVQQFQVNREQKTFNVLDPTWYDRFFHKEDKIQLNINIALLLGQQNYGLSWQLDDGTFVANPVFGIWKWTDLMVVIHEFCHPYCNPLIDQHWDRMAPVAEQAFDDQREILSRSAYTSPRIMMYETLVRASTIEYVRENLPQYFSEDMIENERQQGFILIDKVLNSLGDYAQNKAQYPTLDSYFPVLLEDLNR